MEIHIVFPEDENTPYLFTSQQKEMINREIHAATLRAAALLPLKLPIRFCVYPIEGGVAKRLILGYLRIVGMAQWKHGIDLEIRRYPFNIRGLGATVLHELHHVTRGYIAPPLGPKSFGSGHRLVDAVFGEGLAVAFELEQVPDTNHFAHYDDSVWWLLPYLRIQLTNREYNFKAWFRYSPWDGYRLGKALVDRVVERNPGITSASLVHTDSMELWRMSGHFL